MAALRTGNAEQNGQDHPELADMYETGRREQDRNETRMMVYEIFMDSLAMTAAVMWLFNAGKLALRFHPTVLFGILLVCVQFLCLCIIFDWILINLLRKLKRFWNYYRPIAFCCINVTLLMLQKINKFYEERDACTCTKRDITPTDQLQTN